MQELQDERERLLNELKEALNPPPPRPTKEECIEWIGNMVDSVYQCYSDKSLFNATIDYLKKPSLQWVKNTGVVPSCKAVLIKTKEEIIEGEPEDFAWRLDFQTPIIEYIIIE
jgi:hypothetical protein